MRLSEVSTTHTPPPALSRHGTFWWLLQVAVFTVLAIVADSMVEAAPAFGFDQVSQRAKALAAKRYAAPTNALPADLKQLSYDQYRDIRFKPEQATWRAEGLPFELMFFHAGAQHSQPVSINEVTPQGVRHLAFDQKVFDYGRTTTVAPATWGDVGFAGFRVHTALNNAGYKDELAVFLGASYFRMLGKGQAYGLSARGLAIDTAAGAAGTSREEFPRFTEFWIERPTAQATSLVIHALMESPKATGAYRFEIRPGSDTVADVRSRLYLRAGATKTTVLGLAPLTSMFQHGENNPRAPRQSDFRPEVHDSDGLMVAGDNGEWLWRPLLNPTQPQVSRFAARNLKGFGLMQRDRGFGSYEDLEARYERRPSTWIEPVGNWGPGRVELVQLPTPDETHDNIVAYWVPDTLPAAGQPLDVAYRIRWQGETQQRPPNAWTVQSRLGGGVSALAPGETQYVVDFAGPALNELPKDAAVHAVVSTSENGALVERNAYRNPDNGQWRMTVRVKRHDLRQPLELRAFLQSDNHALTETWTTIIQPE